MSEFESIGRLIPAERPRDRPRRKVVVPGQGKGPDDEDPQEDLEALEDGSEDEEPRRVKPQEGREIGPPADDEEGQIIDVVA
jgi:hypothetical protein